MSRAGVLFHPHPQTSSALCVLLSGWSKTTDQISQAPDSVGAPNPGVHLNIHSEMLGNVVGFAFQTLPESVHFSVQFSSVTQSCPTLCDPMNRSTPGQPVHHQLPESTQTHVPRVGDAIQPSHPLPSPCPPTFNLSQHQGLFK